MEDVCQLYFRSAILNDCQAIYKVHVSSIRSVCGGSGLYTPQQIDLWVNRQSVDRYVDPITTDRVMVACKTGDDSIVGFGHYEFIDDNTMEIKALYVSPDCVNIGIGSKLMKQFDAIAKKQGGIVKKMIVASSANAIDFYKKHGFISEGETVHCEQGCVSINCTKMLKDLHHV